jgi:hypothetical protein
LAAASNGMGNGLRFCELGLLALRGVCFIGLGKNPDK